ncbi:MAG TPA: hypothetical protein H9866_07125 [Candidatus Tidjanibacter gallistercoris]|nr:hypothetical protein [Candidatus Tidjanibacter gallistercoris]
MDRFGKLRRVIVLLTVLFVLDLVLLVWMIPVRTFLTWGVAVVQAVVVVYFVALSLGLVREAEERDRDGE